MGKSGKEKRVAPTWRELFNLKFFISMSLLMFQVFLWTCGNIYIIGHTTGHHLTIIIIWTVLQFFSFKYLRKKMNIPSALADP
jgi:hypothetical protein